MLGPPPEHTSSARAVHERSLVDRGVAPFRGGTDGCGVSHVVTRREIEAHYVVSGIDQGGLDGSTDLPVMAGHQVTHVAGIVAVADRGCGGR